MHLQLNVRPKCAFCHDLLGLENDKLGPEEKSVWETALVQVITHICQIVL